MAIASGSGSGSGSGSVRHIKKRATAFRIIELDEIRKMSKDYYGYYKLQKFLRDSAYLVNTKDGLVHPTLEFLRENVKLDVREGGIAMKSYQSAHISDLLDSRLISIEKDVKTILSILSSGVMRNVSRHSERRRVECPICHKYVKALKLHTYLKHTADGKETIEDRLRKMRGG